MNKYFIDSGWLVYDTGECTCAGGTEESSYAHEPYCGVTPCDEMSEIAPALIKAGWTPPQPKRQESIAPRPICGDPDCLTCIYT